VGALARLRTTSSPVREREKERGREREKEGRRERKREGEKERGRERESKRGRDVELYRILKRNDGCLGTF